MTNQLTRPIVEEGSLLRDNEEATFETQAGFCCLLHGQGLRRFFQCPSCNACWVEWVGENGFRSWKRPASYLASRGIETDSLFE